MAAPADRPARAPAGRRLLRKGERGVLAGGDGLIFALLILFAGSLAVLNTWSIIDTRAALDAAGREYLRAYTHAGDPGTALASGEAAAAEVLAARATPVHTLRIDAPDASAFGPCQPAQVTLHAQVPAVRVPFLDGVASRTVSVRHHELVEPHRELTSAPHHDPEATPCAE